MSPANRLPNKLYFNLAVITLLLICTITTVTASTARTDGLSMGPVVTGTTYNETIIRFLSDQPCNSSILYEGNTSFFASGGYNHRAFGIPNTTSHAIILPDLEPATAYHYSVNGCSSDERDRTFTTLPKTGSCTFIVYGDTREQTPLYTQTDRHMLVADRIAQEPGIRFVINSGDLVSESKDPSEWNRFLEATEHLRSVTTYRAVPGNHDVDRPLFRDLFGIDGVDYFDCGAARIMLLDSTDISSMTLKEQAQWLVSVNGYKDRATIAILHHPIYSSEEKHYGGFENLQQIFVPAFQISGVRLVFNSHVHAFEQVKRHGITYITEGRGGAPAYPLNKTRILGSVHAFENTLGYSRVTVDPAVGEIRVDVIRVADVSPDLRTVTKIYPGETIDAKIRIPLRSTSADLLDISELLYFTENMQDNGTRRNPSGIKVHPQF